MNLTSALYDVLAGDATLAGLLASYRGSPAVFTTDPPPGDAELPYIVTAGAVAQTPWDTKTSRGRQVVRDVRCYAAADGSAAAVETIAERVRALLHRQAFALSGGTVVVADVAGPVGADERDVYARVLSLSLTAQED